MNIKEKIDLIDKELEKIKGNPQINNKPSLKNSIIKVDNLVKDIKGILDPSLNKSQPKNKELSEQKEEQLYEEIRKLRYLKAKEMNLPPWKLFNNKVLEKYISNLPTNYEQFSEIAFAPKKDYNIFGKDIIKLIKTYLGIIETKKDKMKKALDKIIYEGEPKKFDSEDKVKNMAPARKNNKKNIFSKTGFFESEKMNREIGYDSNLEKEFLMMLEKNNKVKYYLPQPYEIKYNVKFTYNGSKYNKRWRYYPDILVVLKDNKKAIIEIKNYFDLVSLRSRIKLELLKKISKNKGYGYLISTNGKHSLNESINYNIDENFEKDIISKIAGKEISYRNYLKIKNRYVSHNYWILPFAYRNDIYMYNKTLAPLNLETIEIQDIKIIQMMSVKAEHSGDKKI